MSSSSAISKLYPSATEPQSLLQNAASTPKNKVGRKNGKKKVKKSSKKATTKSNAKQKKNGMPSKDTMPKVIANLLDEPKVGLMKRVVQQIGQNVAWDLLKRTLQIEREGGMSKTDAVTDGEIPMEDRRSPGGVYLYLLKQDVSPLVYKEIYRIEAEKKKHAKVRSRRRRRQKEDNEIVDAIGLNKLDISQEEKDRQQKTEEDWSALSQLYLSRTSENRDEAQVQAGVGLLALHGEVGEVDEEMAEL